MTDNENNKRKSYETPKIKVHGNIKKLTKGSDGDEADGTAGGTLYTYQG
ncbi:hypothetical protein [Methanobacterium formicicum]|nr:hypothetical protein [Methanobacterium formicicum]